MSTVLYTHPPVHMNHTQMFKPESKESSLVSPIIISSPLPSVTSSFPPFYPFYFISFYPSANPINTVLKTLSEPDHFLLFPLLPPDYRPGSSLSSSTCYVLILRQLTVE